MTKQNKGALLDWTRVDDIWGYYFTGKFVGHPQFDGHFGHTSYVVKQDGDVIETLNSYYRLGMDPAIKKQWLVALRSDEFKQASGMLQNTDGFCCLGVLCRIQGAGEEELLGKTTSAVPEKYAVGLSLELMKSYAIKNDSGKTFLSLADEIEATA